MGDFDPCECIWNHEHAMQRLLNLLRNSQDYCADNECVQDLPGPNGDMGVGGMGMTMMMMMGWLVVATALFLMRPNSLRNDNQKPARNADDHGGNDGPPPPPPPAVM